MKKSELDWEEVSYKSKQQLCFSSYSKHRQVAYAVKFGMCMDLWRTPFLLTYYLEIRTDKKLLSCMWLHHIVCKIHIGLVEVKGHALSRM